MIEQLTQHLKQLCVNIGPRPIGTHGNLAAADYVTAAFRNSGLDVTEQRFDCPDWQCIETHLQVNGESHPAAANVFSPACDLNAPLVPISTVAELEQAELTDRIGVLYGDLAQEPLIPKNCMLYNTERDQKIIRLLEEKHPAALITVNLRPACLTGLIEDWNLLIPSATVPAEVGLSLLRDSSQTVRLKIETRSTPSHSANIVGRRGGTRPEHIVVCAHYDTKVETPGALDNAAGVAGLLALAEHFAHIEANVGLEFVAFTGEEYSNGEADAEYIRLKDEDLGRILAAINLDGIGCGIGANTLTMMSHSPSFRAEVIQVTDKYPGVVWVEPWPQSNHSTFAQRGVPSLALSSIGAFGLAHLPIDTFDWVSLDKLNEVVSLVIEIVGSLQDKSWEWCRKAGQA
jgi:aminopeptidase YwaD